MQIFSRKKRTAPELNAEREKLLAEKAAAQAKHGELIEGRREIELYGELDDLQQHDAEIAKERLLIDRANARLAQIDRDEKALEAEAEQASRMAVYDAAKDAHAKGRDALKAYAKHAGHAADALRAYADAKARIDAANRSLPDGREAIEDPEPSNAVAGHYPTGGGDLPRSGAPHISILDKAVLPDLERHKYFYGEQNAPKAYHR
jgi:hypothetical protein